jgi:diketogulonate reductase-like aldo/keto reductase
MEDLFRIPQGDRCATNQVPYSIVDRRIEHDLLPWCEQHGMPVMAYSPLRINDGSACLKCCAALGTQHLYRTNAPRTLE